MKKTLTFGHQGDVTFGEIPKELEDLLTKDNELSLDSDGFKAIVHGGEKNSANAHVLEYADTPVYRRDFSLVVDNVKENNLVHVNTNTKQLTKEHNTIALKPQKKYFMTGQIEFDTDGQIRPVVD